MREFNKEVVPADVKKFMPETDPRPFLPKKLRWSARFLGWDRTGG